MTRRVILDELKGAESGGWEAGKQRVAVVEMKNPKCIDTSLKIGPIEVRTNMTSVAQEIY